MLSSSSTLARTYDTANSGSIPLEHPAMMLIVPVGAMVVVVAFRTRGPPSRSYTEPAKFGNTPRSAASSTEAARASSCTKPMISPAMRQASSES